MFGPRGGVVAADLDTTRPASAEPGVEVLRHDIGADPPPAGGFDLVHARPVLTHVPARETALRAGGLAEVGAEGFFPITDPACAVLERATAEEVDRHLADLTAGRLPDLATSPLISAWGRRPDPVPRSG